MDRRACICLSVQGILKGILREYCTGNTKYRCTFDHLFDWFGLVCFANKNKNCQCHTADSKSVEQEVNGTVILLPGLSVQI